jgi:hypothetical protein
MFEPHEQALLDSLQRYFDRVVPTGAPLEGSLQVLMRALAGVLATEMGAHEACPRQR